MIDDLVTWLTDPEHWTGPDGVPARLGEHLLYTVVTIGIALVIAVPLGAWVGHTGRARWLVTWANALRAVPSLGLLFAISMLVGPLIQSDLAFTIPSIIVLVLLAIPPLLSGTYAGVESVDPAARDAARGMGMRGTQVLTQVELPIAMPLFLSGLRSATLQVIATATIAASISLGGWVATSSTGSPHGICRRWSRVPCSWPCSRWSLTACSPCSSDTPSPRESRGAAPMLDQPTLDASICRVPAPAPALDRRATARSPTTNRLDLLDSA